MIKQESGKKPVRHAQKKPLRLWPGIVFASVSFITGFMLPAIAPKMLLYGMITAVLSGVATLIWWVFFSRTYIIERISAIVLAIAASYGTFLLLDKSIATSNMGMMFPVYSIPAMSLALVIWAVSTRNLSNPARRIAMVITILLASGVWIFLRTDGMTGDGLHKINWRWAKTDEDRLLAKSGNEVFISPAESFVAADAGWPGFRGTNRDGNVRGLRIRTDWAASAPVEMWRQPVGPGCSSMAIRGNLLYTQEQRGEYEVVSCYNLTNGKPVWKHQDKVRFYDAHAGAGPRATPELAGDCVYTLGGTGILNALDANDGSVKWSRNAASDAGVTVQPWGFTGSPLVTGNIVIVALSGKLAAYETTDGNPKWFGPDGGHAYSSPHLVTIDGISQVVLMSKSGALSVDPASGKKLWELPWEIDGRILQPLQVDNGDLLLSGENKSLRFVNVSQETDDWKVNEKWSSSEIKAYFNDFVIHNGFAYGFDGPNIACISLTDGKRMWKGINYRGFLLLLADQDLLMVLSEKGELSLVQAKPEKFTELSKIQAIKGKTWNHPALAGNILIVRNAREMAAYRLPIIELKE